MARLIITLILLALAIVFILQNTENVEIVFWPWKAEVSKAVLSLGTLFLGLIIGLIVGIFLRRKG